MPELGLDDTAAVKLLALVATRPQFGNVFCHDVEFTRLEGFQPHGIVPQVAKADTVKVVLPAPHRQVFGPVVITPLVLALLAQIEPRQTVWPAADRRFQHLAAQRGSCQPFVRKNR